MADTGGSSGSQSGVDIQKYLDVLAKQKAFILVFVLSAILSSLSLTYITSKKYEAATTIFYRPIEMSMLRAREIESFGAPVPTPPFKVIMQTLRDAVKNESVLRPVVGELELDKSIKAEYSSWYKRWFYETKDFVRSRISDLWQLLKYGWLIEEDSTVEAITTLRKNIDIVATRDSYIYVLKVKDKHPERAARIVDAAGQRLIEWLKSEQQSASYKRLQELQKQLVDQENEIRALRAEREDLLNENNLVSIAEETTKGVANLYEMELENVRISAQIEKKQEEVAEYEEKIQAGSKVAVRSEDFKTMVSNKLFGEIDMKGLIAQKDFLKSSIRDQKSRLQQLPVLQSKLDDLEMKISAATREHQHFKDFYTEVFTDVTTSPGETRVLHGAIGSLRPVQPIKVYHVGLTAFLGLMLSIGLVYVLDFLNIRVFFSGRDGKGISGKSLSGLSGTDWLSSVFGELAHNIAAKGGSLFLCQENNLVLAQSLDPGHAPVTIPFPLKEGSVFEQVLKTGHAILTEDIEKQGDFVLSGWNGYMDRSSVVFPLIDATGEKIGIISLHNKTTGSFTTEDKEFGTALLNYHILRQTSEETAYKIQEEKKPKRGFLKLFFWRSIIILCGLTLGVMVFYLLRKVGF